MISLTGHVIDDVVAAEKNAVAGRRVQCLQQPCPGDSLPVHKLNEYATHLHWMDPSDDVDGAQY